MLKQIFTDTGTIILARLQLISSVVLGALAGMDYTPFIAGTPMTQGQMLWIAGVMFGHAIVLELVRRNPKSKDPV